MLRALSPSTECDLVVGARRATLSRREAALSGAGGPARVSVSCEPFYPQQQQPHGPALGQGGAGSSPAPFSAREESLYLAPARCHPG